jgi:hypothetical protein
LQRLSAQPLTTTQPSREQAKNGYALEPDPYAFDEVRANLALNPRLQDHTSIFWKCIMDKPGIYPMGGGGGDSMASVGSANHPKSWKVRSHLPGHHHVVSVP